MSMFSKKLVSVVCCLAPFSAGAASFAYPDGLNIGSTDTSQTIDATIDPITGKPKYDGLVLGDGTTTNGLNVAGAVDIGGTEHPQGGTGGLAVLREAGVFTIQSDGNITIGNNLKIASGVTLGIQNGTAAGMDVSIGGTINALGALSVVANSGVAGGGINSFTSGAINASDTLRISAGTINTGAIEVVATTANAEINLNATDSVSMKQFSYNNANKTGQIEAGGNITSGTIQNLAGSLNITAGGDLELTTDTGITGSLENKAAGTVTVSAKNITVAGAITNEDTSGTMNINGDSLTINGGNPNNASIVNSGVFVANISGLTKIAQNIDWNNMTDSGKFTLKTGSLQMAGDILLKQGMANIETTLGDMSFGAISNESVLPQENIAGLTLNSAGNFTSTSIRNTGTLDIRGLSITTGAISGDGANANATIAAAGAFVGGDVSNTDSSRMRIDGNTVKLSSITNTGDLRVAASASSSGALTVDGNVVNSASAGGTGVLDITARNITIGGDLTNNSGLMTVIGSGSASDNISAQNLNVLGGSVEMNALIGNIQILDKMIVSGGKLSLRSAVKNLTVENSVQIDGNFIASGSAAANAGDMSVAADGTTAFVLKSNNGTINVGGDVRVTDTIARTVRMDASQMDVGGDVIAQNANQKIVFGASDAVHAAGQTLNVAGAVSAIDGAQLEITAADANVASLTNRGTTNGLIVLSGKSLTATAGDISVGGELLFNNTTPTLGMTGMLIAGDEYAFETSAGNISVDSATIANGKTLTLTSHQNFTMAGALSTNGIVKIDAAGIAKIGGQTSNGGTLTINGASVDMGALVGSGITNINSTSDLTMGQIDNTGTLNLVAADSVTAGAIESNQKLNIATDKLNMAMLTVSGGSAVINAPTITSDGLISVAGNITHASGVAAAAASGLSIVGNTNVTADSLTATGALMADTGAVAYNVKNAVAFTGAANVAAGATTAISSENSSIAFGGISNNGTLTLSSARGMTLGAVDNNGDLTIASGTDVANVDYFANNGTAKLSGAGMKSAGAFTVNNLYQNYAGTIAARDANITDNSYALSASNVIVGGNIQQTSGALDINTSDLTVAGNIDVKNMHVYSNAGLTVGVNGNVSGGTRFGGLQEMTIGGNYLFDNDSGLYVDVRRRDVLTAPTRNYWSSISLTDDNTLGRITNATDGNAGALIQVDGAFTSDLSLARNPSNGFANATNQIGVALRELATAGDAIWLVHADNGITELGDKLRNLNVVVCNNAGTLCYDYFSGALVDTDAAYLTVRDTDNDGKNDSIYLVFDPRFGGPVEVFKIQPIVGRTPEHTSGEYMSAGALDNMLAGAASSKGFYGRHSLEMLPVIFRGTNLEQLGNELYNRMEHYATYRDGTALSRFSRLVQPREIEQVVGSIVLNEHTNFRSFEDRMFDEFIWNRNRNLKKAWVDAEFGMFNQKVSDGKRVDGNRINVAGGFDWQHSETLILGLTGRVSHMSADNSDSMNLGYTVERPFIAGNVDVKVADTNIGLGGYLMQTLGDKTRVYGNAFLDIHVLDTTRHQTYMNGAIDGTGYDVAFTSEWGLLHDWLNQYVVGNMYARIGYNFGFSLTEKARGHDYMDMESDGYLIFTPGYSLTAQKRIYPSAWFQIRPYATIGIEYDVLGAPDNAKYKFSVANSFTKYDIDIDPMWANIGGGLEMLSAYGLQVGLDYRYQYNQDIQLHNIKVSGSYRF